MGCSILPGKRRPVHGAYARFLDSVSATPSGRSAVFPGVPLADVRDLPIMPVMQGAKNSCQMRLKLPHLRRSKKAGDC